jgi:hypothetical protein
MILLAYNHALRITEVYYLTPGNFTQCWLYHHSACERPPTDHPALLEMNGQQPRLGSPNARDGSASFGIKRSQLSNLFERHASLAEINEVVISSSAHGRHPSPVFRIKVE